MRYSVMLLAAVAMTLSACEHKAEGQTVAVVNGEEITSAELNQELTMANVPADADKKAVTARVLQTLIDRRLLAQQARADGLDKTPEYLARQRRATEDALIAMVAQRKLSTVKLPSTDEVAAYQASHPEQFAKRETLTISQVEFDTQKDPSVVRSLVAAHSLDAVAAALSAKGIAFTRATRKITSSDLPHDLYERIIGLPSGEPFLIPAGPKTVVNVVTGREPAPLAADATQPAAVAALRQTSGSKIMESMIKDLRGKAKIDYKPGFQPAKS